MHLLNVLLFAAAACAEVDLAKILALQDKLPACSVQCIQTTAAQHNCTVIDLACQCSNMQAIIQDVTPCFVRAGCGLEDIAHAAQTSFEICNVVAEGAAQNMSSTDTVNPALPKMTTVDLEDGAMNKRVATGALALVAIVAGAVMM
ncbi:hypothetical protein CC79DRAFT_1123863 [Sarocladium strictum]